MAQKTDVTKSEINGDLLEPAEIYKKIKDLAEDRDYFESRFKTERSTRTKLEGRAGVLEAEIEELNEGMDFYISQVEEARKKAEEAEGVAAAYRKVDSDIAKHYIQQEKIDRYVKIKEILNAGDETVIRRVEELKEKAEASALASYLKPKRFAGMKESVATIAFCVAVAMGGNWLINKYQQQLEDNDGKDKIEETVKTIPESCLDYSSHLEGDGFINCSTENFTKYFPEIFYNIDFSYDEISENYEIANLIENWLAHLGEKEKSTTPKRPRRREVEAPAERAEPKKQPEAVPPPLPLLSPETPSAGGSAVKKTERQEGEKR